MSKRLIQLFKMVFFVVIIFSVLYLITGGFWKFVYTIRDSSHRFIEYEPLQGVAEIESCFGIKMPKSAKDIKYAKSPPVDGFIYFICKFTADSNSCEPFINSFPSEGMLPLGDYNRQDDERKNFGWWKPFKWFTEHIDKGEIGVYYNNKGKLQFYIDHQRDKYVYYIFGSRGQSINN